MSSQINRIVLVKPATQGLEAVERLVSLFEEMWKTQSKDGKPYILSLEAGPAAEDARNQGYAFACRLTFASLDDMKYYDEECAAHQRIKSVSKAEGLVADLVVVNYQPAFTGHL